MQKFKMLKEQKAITLVALVITIIILLILAGISISALTNQGLFTQAQNAKNLTEEKTAEENEILTNYLEQMNAIIGGQVTESIPDGAVVTPINDITTWLKTAGISKQYSYTTIEQVIVDSTCTQSLMNNENAMKYLARSTEFANAICASETTMTYLGQSAYVDNTVLNSDIWSESIYNSNYFDKVFVKLIPNLTSNDSASDIGTVISAYLLDTSYKTFDGDVNTYDDGASTSSWSTHYTGFLFSGTVKVFRVDMFPNGTAAKYNITLQYSDDGSTWLNASDVYSKEPSSTEKILLENKTVQSAHKYWRIFLSDRTNAMSWGCVNELTFYGRP